MGDIEVNVGENFSRALAKISYDTNEERTRATENMTAIMERVIRSYNNSYKVGEVGKSGTGVASGNNTSAVSTAVGLLYGYIQSGKTRAMILSSALALDNGFRIVVILTSNINRLVSQTHGDFIGGLPGVKIYSKADIKGKSVDSEAAHITNSLEEEPSYGLVLVCSKGVTVLNQVAELLKKINASKYPTMILDDEGDQASLDTNTASRTKNKPELKSSTIHRLIHEEIRSAMPHSVFVSVTGTPQGIFLQSVGSKSRPSFVHILEAGSGYTGGQIFFKEDNPKAVPYMSIIDADENIRLLEPGNEIPAGLEDAVCLFVVAATAAGIQNGWNEYKMLCHPSVKTADHDTVKDLIGVYVSEIIKALRHPDDEASATIMKKLRSAYKELGKTQSELADFDVICNTAKAGLPRRQLAVINKNTTNDDIRYDNQYNFLVGGNTVGRGLAIANLLVTYYTREPKSATMDTMYQHARMFGYRKKTLPYTRVFLPDSLYQRFHEIYLSDENARAYVKTLKYDNKGNILLKVKPGLGLKPTRSNILDGPRTKTIFPGRQIFPNRPIFKKGEVELRFSEIEESLRRLNPDYDTDQSGLPIDVSDAIKLLGLIKTNATNLWSDKQIPAYLTTFAKQMKTDKVLLRFRTTDRNADDLTDGHLSQGVLAGDRLQQARDGEIPTVWVFKVSGKGKGWDGVDFFYPTIVAPSKLDSSFVFNKS